jgi:hypothetical protein
MSFVKTNCVLALLQAYAIARVEPTTRTWMLDNLMQRPDAFQRNTYDKAILILIREGCLCGTLVCLSADTHMVYQRLPPTDHAAFLRVRVELEKLLPSVAFIPHKEYVAIRTEMFGKLRQGLVFVPSKMLNEKDRIILQSIIANGQVFQRFWFATLNQQSIEHIELFSMLLCWICIPLIIQCLL